MFKPVVVLIAVLVACVSSQADRYPAGLNPALCPGYPRCDNSLLALHSARTGNDEPVADYTATRYPAGVPAAACPNYPFCNTGEAYGYSAAGPLPGFTRRLYPDGVPAAACPNYPFCH